MKIDVGRIVTDHLATLQRHNSRSTSYGDIALFYGVPILAALCVLYFQAKISREFHNVSITFFGIFSALLLNIQVAVFGIFSKKFDLPDDPRDRQIALERNENRNILLKEVNANISYAVLVACIALFLFVLLYVSDICGPVASSLSAMIYGHFLLTLLMIVKRSHFLFHGAYSN